MPRFETPGPVTLRLANPAGWVRVVLHDDPVTEVELQPLSPGADRLVGQATVEAVPRASGQEVVVDVPEARMGFPAGQPEVGVEVRAPRDADIVTKTASADVSVRGPSGSVRTQSASGQVDLDEVGGDAELRTASGDIRVASVGGRLNARSASGDQVVGWVAGRVDLDTGSGDIRLDRTGATGVIQTASGDVNVREVGGELTLRTASGNLRVGSVAAGPVRVQSVSGDASIGVAPGCRLSVEAETVSGNLRSDIPLDDSPAAGEEGPLVELWARTVSGDLWINRATPALNVREAL